MLLPVLRHPHVGVLIWCWTAMVIPTYFVYSFALSIPFNKVVALLTLLAWAASREPKRIRFDSTMTLLVVFTVFGTLSFLLGIGDFDISMTEWSKFVKIIALSFVVVGLITSKERIDALLYAVYLSLGFHGILEGAKFLASGGGHNVWGPGGSVIGDNNHFALALVMVLPLVFYLFKQARRRVLKLALIASSILVVAAIMGTFSRGGLIGVAAVGFYALMRTGNKIKYLMYVLPLLVAAAVFAPDRWTNRMDTISDAGGDSSFGLRIVAWKQSVLIALDNPILGGGFHAVQDKPVWVTYSQQFERLSFIPSQPVDPTRARAAHSIYFQVLGDMGFVGLAIFLCLLASSWRNATVVELSTKQKPEFFWARDLAVSLKYSLIAYMVSGAALSMAYFDFAYAILALLVVLRTIVGEPVKAPAWMRGTAHA